MLYSVPLKTNLWLYIVVVLLIFSCNNKQPTFSDIAPEDSFRIFAPNHKSMYYYQCLNDSVIVTNTDDGRFISIYHSDGSEINGTKTFLLKRSIPVELSGELSMESLFSVKGDSFLFAGDKNMLIYTARDNRYRRYFTSESKPFLGAKFAFFQEHIFAPVFRNGMFIASFYPYNPTYYPQAIREKTISVYRVQDTALVRIKDAIDKPAGLFESQNSSPIFCTTDSLLVLAYPAFDTFYILNLNTLEERKVAIGNPHYRKPGFFDIQKARDQEYATGYYMKNFNYLGIFFNVRTKHFVLFFDAPYLQQDEKYPNDAYAITLNEQFEILDYYALGGAYTDAVTFFNIPGRGIALRLANIPDYDSVQHYHIYNF